jgi:hypothetical protein
MRIHADPDPGKTLKQKFCFNFRHLIAFFFSLILALSKFLDPDPHSVSGSAFRIRIRIRYADLDAAPGDHGIRTWKKTQTKLSRILPRYYE